MKRILSVVLVAALMVAMLSVGAGSAFAKSPQSQGNCSENIAKQTAGGNTGATGSEKDEKRLNLAVTNCNQIWQVFGANP